MIIGYNNKRKTQHQNIHRMIPLSTQKLLSPQQIVAQFDIRPGMSIADFGSGAGDFAIAIAQAVGSAGKVYAIDVLESAHQSLRSKARMADIRNIEMLLTNLETPTGSTLPDQSVDQVMIHNVLFQVQDKVQIIRDAHRILKPTGTLNIVEWDISSPIGPSQKSRLSESEVTSLVTSLGFSIQKKIQAGVYHYGIIYHI